MGCLLHILCQLSVLSPQTAHVVGMVNCIIVPSLQEYYTSLHFGRSQCLLRVRGVHFIIQDVRLGHVTIRGQ